MPEELTAAAGRITRVLVEWLGDRSWIPADAISDAVERSDDAARDLPRAERLGRLLYQQAQRDRPGHAGRRGLRRGLSDDRARGALRIVFEGGIGPVPVGAAAAKLAQTGWSVNHVLGRKSGKWHVLEVGNVCP